MGRRWSDSIRIAHLDWLAALPSVRMHVMRKVSCRLIWTDLCVSDLVRPLRKAVHLACQDSRKGHESILQRG